jgi:hypothetical protein
MSAEVSRGAAVSVEVRQRAARMVFDHQHEYSSQWKAIESSAMFGA